MTNDFDYVKKKALLLFTYPAPGVYKINTLIRIPDGRTNRLTKTRKSNRLLTLRNCIQTRFIESKISPFTFAQLYSRLINFHWVQGITMCPCIFTYVNRLVSRTFELQITFKCVTLTYACQYLYTDKSIECYDF